MPQYYPKWNIPLKPGATLKSTMVQSCPLSSSLFNIVLEALNDSIEQGKEIIWIHIEEVTVYKLYFITHYMIIYIRDSKLHQDTFINNQQFQ